MKSPQKQRGFSLLATSLALGVLAYVGLQLIPLSARLQLYTYRMATVTGINELAQASKTYFVDPVNASSWPASPDVLVSNDYLSGFVNRNGYGFPYAFTVTGNTLLVTTQVLDAAQAVNVASHFGGLATVAGSSVTTRWSVPGNDANHQALIPRDGTRDVFGTITHRAGSGANLVMSGNDINAVNNMDSGGTVTIRNGSTTGLISTDIGAIDVLTVNDIRITP